MGRRKKRTHGEGSIYQRSDDGRWVAQITVNGKRYTFSGKDREEVLQRLQEAQADRLHGEFVPRNKLTLAEWLETWLNIYKKPSISESTYRCYSNTIRNHIVPHIGNIKLQQLTPLHLQELYADLHKRGLLRTATLAHLVLYMSLEQAAIERKIPKNVAKLVEAPKWKAPKAKALEVEDLQRFLQAASNYSLYPAIVLEATTGMRRGEVLGLRWEDINFDKGVIYIRQALVEIGGKIRIHPTKTESGARAMPVPQPVLELLREHRRHQEEAATVLGWDKVPELVFTTSKGTPIHPRNYNRTFQTICKKTGLEGVSPHILRHTFATRLLEADIQPRIAQEFLGHADATTTEVIYHHVLPGLKRQVMGKINDITEKLLQFRCNNGENATEINDKEQQNEHAKTAEN
ncbi:tyrosine-type recombinase/integrase [Caldanaerobius polysaccharolyticus]|uniref:tyrosine-type recombinase/integrase n=1 Tax=Caldanaerobius polysaccharolyticus TaxID=44256 RepID=UPI00068FBF0C|nr:tyrosine-type recombinase/integrase [Caldanaerobius polysaccharolyticus]